MAWAGSHPQPFPKPEDARNMENVYSQIGKTRVNKTQNGKKVLFDLGNDIDFPPLIKRITQEENLEDFSFITEDENSAIDQENLSLVCFNKKEFSLIDLKIDPIICQ